MINPLIQAIAKALAIREGSKQPDYDAKYYRDQARELVKSVLIELEVLPS